MSDASRALLDDAERYVRLALRNKADAAEAFVVRERGASLRIERGELSNASMGEEYGVGLSVASRGRVGFAYFTDPTRAKAAVDEAVRSARLLGPARGVAGPARAGRVAGLFDRRVEAWSAEDALEAAEATMAAAKRRAPTANVAGGGLGWGTEEVALATSEGFRGHFRATSVGASVYVVLKDGVNVSTGFESESACSLAEVDFARVGREAADLALRSRRSVKAASGPQTVVFKPSALDGLFEFLFLRGIVAETAHAGESVYGSKLGAHVMPEAWSIVDDARRPGGAMSAPFDDEGVVTRRLEVVKRGALRTFLADRESAARWGGAPSGVAVRAERLSGGRSFRAPAKATGRNLTLEGPRVAQAKLLEGIRRGVLVHDAMGAHTANVASGDFAVSCSTLFAIENGEVTRPLKGAMVSGNFPEALAHLEAAGRDVRALSGAFSPVAMYLPSLRLGALRVSA